MSFSFPLLLILQPLSISFFFLWAATYTKIPQLVAMIELSQSGCFDTGLMFLCTVTSIESSNWLAFPLGKKKKKEKEKKVKREKHEFHETCHSVAFYFMKKDSKRYCDTTTPESIHTKDESKCGSAFAFIFAVNWPVLWM